MTDSQDSASSEQNSKPTPNMNEPQKEAENKGAPPVEDADQASLDLLEKALQEHDPDFQTALTGIGPDLMPENMDAFGLDADMSVHEEKRVQKFFAKLRDSLRTKTLIVKTRFVLFFKQTVPDLIKDFVDFLKSIGAAIKGALGQFGALSLKQKLAVIACFVIFSFTTFLVYRVSTKGLVPDKLNLFTTQLDQLASEEFTLTEAESYSKFYDSPRVSQNVMSLKRMVVNIRASSLSGPRPMVAIEFFVEGYAPEVVIEVKDREAEVQHMFQRVIEGFSYDELDSPEGKKNLQDRLRDRTNRMLTQGNIKRVFFKNFILKP